MRVLPILFNTEMVRAILDGQKTVTRRNCKDGDEYAVPDMDFFDADKRTYAVHSYADMEHTEKLSIVERPCPICPGDFLYVRESFKRNKDGYSGIDFGGYIYKADCKTVFKDLYNPWHPSIHMPKEAARIWLKVTDVRVERLQEITEEQAKKEGIIRIYDDLPDEEYISWAKRTGVYPKRKEDWGYKNYLWHGNFGVHGTGNKISDAWEYQYSSYNSAVDSFSSLWNTTVPLKDWNIYGWAANPWVWVIEFERCGKPGE